MSDGLNVHGDLMAIIARAEAAGIDASQAATIRLAEAGRARMRELLETSEGTAPRPRTGALARSVRMTTTYTETSVRVHVGPSGRQAHIGRILDQGWQAHGPVRRPHTGTHHRYPFVEQVATASRAEAAEIAGAEVGVRLREAGF